jgi:hypothetical protein
MIVTHSSQLHIGSRKSLRIDFGLTSRALELVGVAAVALLEGDDRPRVLLAAEDQLRLLVALMIVRDRRADRRDQDREDRDGDDDAD